MHSGKIYFPRPLSKIPSVRILGWQYLSMDKWDVFNPVRQFWRLYWNNGPGALIICNGRTYELTGEQLLVIPSYCNFKAQLSRPVEHFFVHFLPEELCNIKTDIYLLPCPAVLKDIISGEYLPEKVDLLICSLVYEVLAKCPLVQSDGNNVLDSRIKKALYLMDTRPRYECFNENLAREVGMSVSNFEHLFRHEIGIPPKTYLDTQLVERARIMLLAGKMTIDEIAEKLGFPDRNNFAITFKKHTAGVTPGKYRRMNAQNLFPEEE